MSSAFTRESDDGVVDIGERAISPHRNLVTAAGLAQIERELGGARIAFARAEQEQDRRAIALAARDLNYWSARRSTAEVVKPNEDRSEARFGHKVTVRTKSGEETTYQIVGEDEADPKRGLIPHVAPLARALLGKSVGEAADVRHERAKITRIE